MARDATQISSWTVLIDDKTDDDRVGDENQSNLCYVPAESLQVKISAEESLISWEAKNRELDIPIKNVAVVYSL